jgi:hypothetical protein
MFGGMTEGEKKREAEYEAQARRNYEAHMAPQRAREAAEAVAWQAHVNALPAAQKADMDRRAADMVATQRSEYEKDVNYVPADPSQAKESMLRRFSAFPAHGKQVLGITPEQWEQRINVLKNSSDPNVIMPAAKSISKDMAMYNRFMVDPEFREQTEQRGGFVDWLHDYAAPFIDKSLPVIGGAIGSLIGGPIGGTVGGGLGGAGKGGIEGKEKFNELLPDILSGAGTGALVGAGMSGLGHMTGNAMLQSGALSSSSAPAGLTQRGGGFGGGGVGAKGLPPVVKATPSWAAPSSSSSLSSVGGKALPSVVKATPSWIAPGAAKVGAGLSAAAGAAKAAASAPESASFLSKISSGLGGIGTKIMDAITKDPLQAALLATAIGGSLMRKEVPGKVVAPPKFKKEDLVIPWPEHLQAKPIKPLSIRHRPAPKKYKPGIDPEHHYFSYDPEEDIQYYAKGGFVHGNSGGADDDVFTEIPEGSFIANSTATSLLGDGNTAAGAKELDRFEKSVMAKKASGGKIKGQGRMMPVKLSSGEYQISPNTVNKLGKGSNAKGAKILQNAFNSLIKQKGVKKMLPPKAKPLSNYIRGI